MEWEEEKMERRMSEQLMQVARERAILERVMYKSANQHRRCLYFRRLRQVRRDLWLLQSSHLDARAQHALTLLRTHRNGEQKEDNLVQITYLRKCLLGTARLLEQMSDPILNASSQIAGLLQQTFFMPFALTVLSCLSRFRVLLQQVLCDVTLIYNRLSSLGKDLLAQHHVSQILQCGSKIEDLPMSLECEWDESKFILFQMHSRQFVGSSIIKNGSTSTSCEEKSFENLPQENLRALCQNITNLERNDLMNVNLFDSEIQRDEREPIKNQNALDNRLNLNGNSSIARITKAGTEPDTSLIQASLQEAAPDISGDYMCLNVSGDSKNLMFQSKVNKKVAYISVDVKHSNAQATAMSTDASKIHVVSAHNKDTTGVEIKESRSECDLLFDMLWGMGPQKTGTLF